MDNYQAVVAQMEDFGVQFRDKDLPLVIDAPKRRGCGKGGKWWYWLRTFRPDAGGSFIVGRYGSYKTGESTKVQVNWRPLGDAERARLKAEREAAQARADEARRKEAELAALNAAELWARASKEGSSEYLVRKQVQPEACRYLTEQWVLRWPGRRPGDEDTVVRLTAGTLALPLIRYDWPREQALRGLQFIRPDGFKLFTRGFDKPGCALRLGTLDPAAPPPLMLVCEGYATGLTLRMATDHAYPVFVALDAGSLQHVLPLLRRVYPKVRMLVCADDDWKTVDHAGRLTNPGKTAAMKTARQVPGCDFTYPVFDAATRGNKDTDFNDLHVRQGLEAVRLQMGAVVQAMRTIYG
jgi:putative DNA primase/helicase